MKLRSLLLAGAASVLLPVGGFMMTQSVLHSAALAESGSSIAQSTPSTASPESGRRGKGGWGAKWQEQLNLSADQKARIQAIRDQEKTSSQSLRQQMKTVREKNESLLSSNASVEQLRQQHRDMQALRQQAEDRRFETMLKIREVLTPEQRTKAAQFMKEHRGGRHHGGAQGKQAGAMM